MMAASELRVGFIGSGWIAGVHASALVGIPGVRLTACMDARIEQAQKLAAWTGCKPTTEVAEVIDTCDAVWVCTPPTCHREHVIPCLEAGRPVFCEKPLAGALADGRAIAKVAESTGVLSAIGFNQRFRDPWRKCKDVLDSGEMGQPVTFFCQRLDGPPAGGWRLDPDLMVGMTIESVSHDVDLIRWLLGEVFEVSARLASSSPERPKFDDCLNAILQLQTGAVANIQASWSSALRATRHSIIGTAGSVFVEGPRPFQFSRLRTAQNGAEAQHVYDYAGTSEGYAEACAHFVAAVRDDVPLTIPITDGLRALEICTAMHDSSSLEGETVSLGDIGSRLKV